MSKQIIAVDVDDVLAISTAAWVTYSNKKWGTRLTVEDYTEDWAKMWGLNQPQVLKRADQMSQDKLTTTFDKFQDAETILKNLSKHYKLVITTSRGEILRKDTLEWINMHFEGVFEEVHHTGFYDGQHKDPFDLTKAELCKSIGANYLIDDHPKHCFAAAEAGVHSLLFGDYPWNRSIRKLPAGVTRVPNWQEVEEFFNDKL
jgi:5'(3')-deoxyribonucleotidase